MQVHKIKAKSLLTILLIIAFSLSLLALVVDTLEAVLIEDIKLGVNSTLTQANELLADLAMTKNVNDSFPFVGDQVIFTLRVDNNGPSDASGVEVTDQLPSGYTYVSHSGGGNYNPGSGVWNVGSIDDDDSEQLRITAVVDPSGNYNNVATITGLDQTDPDTSDNQDNASTNPIPVADLAMTKDVDDSNPFVDEEVVFTLRVDNNGPSNITGVDVSDQLPSGYNYVSHSGGGDYLPGIGLWIVGSINAGAFVELQITAQVNPSGDYTNIAQITDLNGRDPNPDNDQDSATTFPIPVADIGIKKLASSNEVTAGDNLTFTLVITNNGPSLASSVQVTDDLAVELNLITATTTAGSCSGDDLISCDLGNLGADKAVTVTILVNVDGSSAGLVENTASVNSPTTDLNEGNNSDTISITVLERIFLIHLPFLNKKNDYGEPNDQCETATDILVNVDNEFLPEDRDDWYQFDLPNSGDLVVELSNFTPMEGQLTVYQGDSCATRIFLGINGNPAMDKVVDLGTQPAGHYYIYVSNDADPSFVPYNLQVNFTP